MDTVMKKVLEMAVENQASRKMIPGRLQALDLARVLAAAVEEVAASLGAATLTLGLTQEVSQSLNQMGPKRTKSKQNHRKLMEPSFGNLTLVFWLFRDLQCLRSSHSRRTQLHLTVGQKRVPLALKTRTTPPARSRGKSIMMKIGKCPGQDPRLSLVQILNLKKREIKVAVMRQNLTMSQKTKSKAENLKVDVSQKMGKKFLDKRRGRLTHLKMRMMTTMIMINEALAAKLQST